MPLCPLVLVPKNNMEWGVLRISRVRRRGFVSIVVVRLLCLLESTSSSSPGSAHHDERRDIILNTISV
jgi:hypothetical protein